MRPKKAADRQLELNLDKEEFDFYTDIAPDEENPYEYLDDELIDLKPSEFTEFAMFMPTGGEYKRFSFEGRQYMRTIYDTPAKRRILMAGRQVEKSTLLGNQTLAYSAMNVGFKTLYVSPSNTQTKVFSRDRIKEPLETSPILRNFTNSKLLANVLEKKFVNRSQITLRFAFLNADRCRGIPADFILIDEFQDILLENIPVIEECASHSEHKLFCYSGTPKSMDNAIEYYFSRFSTQNEWVVPCRKHGTPNDKGSWHWNVLGEDSIGPNGLICDKCGGDISARDPDACWAALNPDPGVEKPFEGFRLPQLMVPWMDWDDLLHKHQVYSRAKFYNEVLGRSFDSGTRPLTLQDVKDNCSPKLSMYHHLKVAKKHAGHIPIFMGLDWGCHDEETRILTKEGFKYFRDLTDDDEVAQFDESRKMTFTKPIVRTVRDWDGELLHFEGRAMDMMLTNTHRMLVKPKRWERWTVERAGDLVERAAQAHFVGSVKWDGEAEKTFTLPGLPSSPGYPGCKPRVFLMDDWLEFLGYFLSEGGLCMVPAADGTKRPSCLKLSQRETVHPQQTEKIRDCMLRLGIEFQEYPNPETGDVNWTICGKQFWAWVEQNVGSSADKKRIPRQFLSLSSRQLKILFDAMVLGDGSRDPRFGHTNGYYASTSKGLCEDAQELCIRLGLRSTLSLHKPAEGNRKARWRMSFSRGDDFAFNNPKENVKHVPYKGKVYCCKVPTGFIVTERNGRIAYQGNTGEGTFTVMTLGGYMPWAPDLFTCFYWKRFEGSESEPQKQLEVITHYADLFKVMHIGTDYGGGHWPNDELVRRYGSQKVHKYQWLGNPKAKVKFEPRLGVPRFLCHRTEVMSDIFNAVKRRNVFSFPRFEEFEEPHATDFINIFSEYNDRTRMNVYKHAPGMPDDSFHALCFCFLASFFWKKRPDVVVPKRELEYAQEQNEKEEYDIVFN